MPGGCCIYHKTIVEPDLFVPVPFDDVVFIKPPAHEVCARAQSRDDRAGFWLQLQYCFMIKMIPMIVRKKEIIDRRNVICCIHIGTGITAGGEFQRRSASA